MHLLVSPGHPRSLPMMMQSLGRRYVGRFNILHGRTGTLWEGRYKAALVDTDSYLLACYRYIELNPVRAGMVAAPADYRWSSHRANALGNDDRVVTPHPSFLALASCAERRRRAYRRMFGEPMPTGVIDAIRDATQFQWALGNTAFRAHVERCTGRRADRRTPGRRTGVSERERTKKGV